MRNTDFIAEIRLSRLKFPVQQSLSKILLRIEHPSSRLLNALAGKTKFDFHVGENFNVITSDVFQRALKGAQASFVASYIT